MCCLFIKLNCLIVQLFNLYKKYTVGIKTIVKWMKNDGVNVVFLVSELIVLAIRIIIPMIIISIIKKKSNPGE
jgi:hypothetical protein